MWSSNFIRSFLTSRAGSVSLMAAFLLPVLIVAVFGAVGLSVLSTHKSRLQAELDAMALDAARVFVTHAGDSERAIQAEIDRLSTVRLSTVAASEKVYRPLRLRSVVDFEASTVSFRLTGPLVIQPLEIVWAGGISLNLQAAAVAESKSVPVCILALESGSGTALTFTGSGRVKAKDCVIWSNSVGPQSIRFNGRGKIESERLCTVGRAGAPGRFAVEPQAEERCAPVPDPMAAWTPPTVGACDHNDDRWIEGNTVFLEPGVYCAGLRVRAKKLVLRDGVYIVRGPLVLHSEKKIEGDAVGLYVTGEDARVEIDGEGSVDIRSLHSGPMSGIVIAVDRRTSERRQSIVMGRVDLKIGGVIYAPNQDITYWGESDTRAASPVTTLIARTVTIGGDAYLEVTNDKDKAPYAPIVETGHGTVRLLQ